MRRNIPIKIMPLNRNRSRNIPEPFEILRRWREMPHNFWWERINFDNHFYSAENTRRRGIRIIANDSVFINAVSMMGLLFAQSTQDLTPLPALALLSPAIRFKRWWLAKHSAQQPRASICHVIIANKYIKANNL